MKSIVTCLLVFVVLYPLSPVRAQRNGPPDTSAVPGSTVAQPADTLSAPLTFGTQLAEEANRKTTDLPDIRVLAWGMAQHLKDVPASIGLVDATQLQRFSNTSIVAAVNTIPGARMDERSPGSYRLAIRGSSLRAPFGVRNVKIYYNGIPFTDPSGNTYLAQIGFYNIAAIEIIKGPGSSMYGAGTGGVALIRSRTAAPPGVSIDVTGGSFGLAHLSAEARTADSAGKLRSVVRYQHLTSDGDRRHTAMRRDILSWDAQAAIGAGGLLSTTVLYTDLSYETPGALTLSEYRQDPRDARPRAGATPGAVEANAAIRQKAFLAGATLTQPFGRRWSAVTTLYGAFTAFENPTLRNYTRSSEPHAGGRASLTYSKPLPNGGISCIAGAELQQGLTSSQTYSTISGRSDTLQADDRIANRTAFAFVQTALEKGAWQLTAGLSINVARMQYVRLNVRPYNETIRDFNNEVAPRIAVRYSPGKSGNSNTSLYASVSRGYSPPTTAELSPTGASLNTGLQPEYGWNYEMGLHRAMPPGGRLSYDISCYYFALVNAIVQRRDSAGGDYYTNSGSTQQLGVEASVRYRLIRRQTGVATSGDGEASGIGAVSLFAAYTYQHFRYQTFTQVDADYSGNKLPGASPHTIASGVDWESRFGLYARLSYYYAASFPLNDAGSASLDSYHLLGARVGFRMTHRKAGSMEIFAGGENLADITYSAGPDINAFGGRYYNAAPGRSFYAGISLQHNR